MKVDKQKVEDWKKQHGEIFQIETYFFNTK